MRYVVITIAVALIAAGIYQFSSGKEETPAPVLTDTPVLSAPVCGPANTCNAPEVRPAETAPKPTTVVATAEPKKKFHDPRITRAQELLRDGRKDAAIELFEEVLRENPNDEAALMELGLVFSHDPKQRGRAVQLFEKAIDLDPENEFAMEDLARIRIEEGGEEAGKEAMGKLAAKYPDSAAAAMMYGRSLLAEGDVTAAVTYLEKAAQNPVISESANSALAEAYRRSGNEKKAAEIQEKVIQAEQEFYERHKDDKNDVPEYVGNELVSKKVDLARSLLKTGDRDKARAILDGLLKENPNRADVKALLEQLKNS